MTDQEVQVKRAQVVLARHKAELMARSGVVAVGVGLRQRGGALIEEVAIIVMVKSKRALADLPPGEALPAEIEGIPVDVQEVGEIKAL